MTKFQRLQERVMNYHRLVHAVDEYLVHVNRHLLSGGVNIRFGHLDDVAYSDIKNALIRYRQRLDDQHQKDSVKMEAINELMED